jgi:chemotaxis family two-component system response regulator Rcp1
MGESQPHRAVEILLVEDNPADVELTREALQENKIRNNLNVVNDGEAAMGYVRGEPPFENALRPDLILLDLNLPRKDGREVLAELKADDELRLIPVVILTTSKAEEDILRSYRLQANCYVTKPVKLNEFLEVVKSIDHFWLSIVNLPSK